ncbi:MAG: 50S ribosomal protein L15 [Flavobacteriales bacterium]
MELSNLKPAKGAVKSGKRVGRGQGSGKGGTSTRGHKGAKSRSGYSKKIGFEGGQMPLQRRVPKFGFTNINRKEYKPINVETLQAYITDGKLSEDINKEALVKAGLVKHRDLVKILGEGELTSKVNITAHKFSKTAKETIENAGGTVTTL